MELRHRLWLATAALSAALLAGCGKSEGDSLDKAKAFLDKREVRSATIELKNLLQKKPNSGEGRFLLGRALLESGSAAAAEAELERALENKFPEEVVAPVMARALLAQRQFRKLTDRYARFEIADFQAAVDLKVALATAYAAQGQKDEARAMVARALSIKPDSPEAQLADARLKAAESDIDGALAVLEALLAKSPGTAQAWMLKGDLLLYSKADQTGAAAAYRKAIEARNDTVEAHAALIAMAFAQRDLDGAARQLAELKKIQPNHPQTRFFEAQVAFAKADFKKARELLQPLLQATPENVRVLHLAGATELRLNSLSQAEALLANAVRLAPGFVAARRALAQVYLRERQPAKAQALLRPLVDAGAADSEVLSLLGQAAAMQGDHKVADDLFAKASKLKPEDKRIRAAQALGQLARGNAEAAFVELETIAASEKGTAVDLAIISAHLRRNEVDKALKAIDALEKKQPDSPVPANLRGRVQLQRKDIAAARKSFESALSRDPKYVPAAAALAALDLSEKKPQDAKARFQEVLKADKKNAQAMLAMAELELRTGGTRDQATKWIGDAVAADPTNPLPRLALIDHHVRTGDLKSALAAAQAATAALPDDVQLLDKLARVQAASGDTQQALSSLVKITQLRPTSAAGFVALAEVQLSANDLDGAARSARKAVELEPASDAAQRVSMVVAVRQKRYADAQTVARELQGRHPDEAGGLIAEGDIELEQKNFDSAIAVYRKAIAKPSPGHAPARLHKALVLARRDAEAAKFADSWIASHPKDAVFVFYLGDDALARGDLALAEKRYGEVLKAQPENALALNNVAWLMVQQKRPGAVALAERAVKAAPNQPPLMDTLAAALAAESRLPEALELQKQVVDLAPDKPLFRLNLAKLQLQAGEKSAARTELKKLERLGTRYGGQDEVARLLKDAGS